MLIKGIGTDIVDISRFDKSASRTGGKLLHRLFHQVELSSVHEGSNRIQRLAGRFAAKEAVLKSMGTGLRGMSWKDIIISSDELGSPKVRLEGGALRTATERQISRVLVSISHTRDYCVAYALAVFDITGAFE